MLKHIQMQDLSDFFKTLSERESKGVFFYRINGYSQEIAGFIRSYYEAARRNGVIIEGKLPNPDEKNLAYYEEVMGMDFELSTGFIGAGLKNGCRG